MLLSAKGGRAEEPPPATVPVISPPLPEAHVEDGVYGRLRGDLAGSLELGLVTGQGLGDHGLAPGAELRLLYLATAGVYGSLFRGAPGDGHWQGSTGVELRPLFLGRFLQNMEQGPATLDLLLDSLFFGIGARFQPSLPAGLELSSGLELPLQGRFEGAFLGARVHHTLTAERLGGATGRSETVGFFSLGFRFMSNAHLVDGGDQLSR